VTLHTSFGEGVIYAYATTLTTINQHTKSSLVLKIWLGSTKIKNCWLIWPWPRPFGIVVISRLTPPMAYLVHKIEIETLASAVRETRRKVGNVNIKVIWGDWATQGHRQCHHSIERIFHTVFELLVESRKFSLPTPHAFGAFVRGDPIWFIKNFGIRKLESLFRCLPVDMFSRFDRTLTRDRQTDRQTLGYSIYTALAWRRAVKMLKSATQMNEKAIVRF